MNEPAEVSDSNVPEAAEETRAGRLRTAAVRPAAGDESARRAVRVPTRTALNYWVDAALAGAFLALVWLAAIVQFVFPAGIEAHRHRLWGRTVEEWRRFEFGALCVLAFLVVVHVTLHWNWVCSVTNTLIRRQPAGRDDGGRTLIGVGMLLFLLHVLGASVLWGKFTIAPM